MSVNNGQINGNHSHLESLSSIDSLENKHIDRRASFARNPSFDDMGTVAEAKVLVIYTGGTIGMTRNSNKGKFFFQ